MFGRRRQPPEPAVAALEVGGRRVGVVGLEEILEEVWGLGLEDPARLEEELLAGFRRRNFVPETAAGQYARALRRAYARRFGLPQFDPGEEVATGSMEIKVLGPGCARCHALEKEVLNVLAELGVAADVEKVQDMDRIAQYGVFMTPGLVVNGKVKAAGRVPGKAELKKIITEEMS